MSKPTSNPLTGLRRITLAELHADWLAGRGPAATDRLVARMSLGRLRLPRVESFWPFVPLQGE